MDIFGKRLKNKTMTAILDLDYLFYVCCHNKEGYDTKTLDDVKSAVDHLMFRMLDDVQATNYIGYISGKGNFRKDLNPLYKANRKKTDIPFMKECREYVIERWKATFFDGVEADDLCNITKLAIKDSILVSCDKDINMLEGISYNPQKRQLIDISKEEADYYFWTSMITGDTADNIKGIPGKGIKFAEKLFEGEEGVISNSMRVLREYLSYFGEYNGVKEFHKNYLMLKMLDKLDGFTIPTPIPYEVTIIAPKTEDEFGFSTDNIKIEISKDKF